MHIIMRLRIVAVLLLFLTVATINNTHCNANSNMLCIQDERQALLRFRNDLIDPSGRLSSWAGDEEDCCYWAGVVCDNFTGRVLELHLQNPCAYAAYHWETHDCDNSYLGGNLNPSLLNLKQLSYLNLGNNYFGGIRIPSFIGSLRKLKYLDLSEAGFTGAIPFQLGNLSSLRYLNLGGYDLKAENLRWLSGLLSLQHLDLSYVNLSKASDWLQVTNMLPSLVDLGLYGCQLDTHSSLPTNINFSSLATLDLSYSHFESSLPNWVFTLTGLKSLSLKACSSTPGPIPRDLQNMTNLRHLDLSYNHFDSVIPNWLCNSKTLKSLVLVDNLLRGRIPSGIGNMTSLALIYLSINELEGPIPRSMGNLCGLKEIDLSGNQFGNISDVLQSLVGCTSDSLESLQIWNTQLSGSLMDDQVGHFKSLRDLSLSSISITGPLPESLGRLSSLEYLDLSSNQLTGTLPKSFGRLSKLKLLDLSYNLLRGVISEIQLANLTNLKVIDASDNKLTLKIISPMWSPSFQLVVIRLRSCQVGQQFPNWLQSQKKLLILDLSSTGISDTVPTWFWNLSSLVIADLSHNQLYGEILRIYFPLVYLGSNKFSGSLPKIFSSVSELDLSNNFFSGSISHFLCNKTEVPNQLSFLLLGSNILSGKIPDCWMNWKSLQVIMIENNNLTGNVPRSIRYLQRLQSLHLRNNSLSGKLPSSLQYCRWLQVIDLAENEFVGSIPTWIGERLQDLIVLSLRSNWFSGKIGPEICHLTCLQILDLADNNLSGMIPRCVNNFSAMTTKRNSTGPINFNSRYVLLLEKAFLVTKGGELKYDTTLTLVISLDLSSNHLSGKIHEELTSLLGLQSLNLSRNHFVGTIPKRIGDMIWLESLDLSTNQLSGEIPPSISSLTFLSSFNVSCNNLSGKIPLSTQLQSFNASSFMGNKLCGPPLTNNCSVVREMPNYGGRRQEKKDGSEVDYCLFLSMAIGFVVGFWVVCGPLLFSHSWRRAYFQFVDVILCKFFVVVIGKCC